MISNMKEKIREVADMSIDFLVEHVHSQHPGWSIYSDVLSAYWYNVDLDVKHAVMAELQKEFK